MAAGIIAFVAAVSAFFTYSLLRYHSLYEPEELSEYEMVEQQKYMDEYYKKHPKRNRSRKKKKAVNDPAFENTGLLSKC